MVSVEGDYSVYVTQAASLIKVMHGVSLTSDEKDGLRHTVFYTAQFRADLHAATRSAADDDSVPSTPSARTRLESAAAAASGGDSGPSSEEEEEGRGGAEAQVDAQDDAGAGGNVPMSAAKACMTGRGDLQVRPTTITADVETINSSFRNRTPTPNFKTVSP